MTTPHRAWITTWGCLLSSSMVLHATSSLAQQSQTDVSVVIATPDHVSPDPRLEATLRDLLERQDFRSTFTYAPPSREGLATEAPIAGLAKVWVKQEEGASQAQILILDPVRDRVLMREVPLPEQELDEVAREQIGQIVAAGVEALRDGSVIGVPRQELIAPPPAQKTLPTPPVPYEGLEDRLDDAPLPRVKRSQEPQAEAMWIFTTAVGWLPLWWRETVVGQQFTALVGWTHDERAWTFGLHGGMVLPTWIEADAFRLRFRAWSLAAYVEKQTRLGAGFSFEQLLGGGVSFTWTQVESSRRTSRVLDESDFGLYPQMLGRLGLRKNWTAALSTSLQGGVQFLIQRPRFTASSLAKEEVLWTPWHLNPFVGLELTARFGGVEQE